MRLAVIAMVILTAVAFAGCGSSEPKSLEEYIDQNPDAREEVDKAVQMDSLSDIMDVEVNYKGNDVIITCSLKTTYDEDIIKTVVKAYEEKEADLKGTVDEAVKQIESETRRTHEAVTIDLDLMQYDGQRYHEKDWQRPYVTMLIKQ